MIHYILQTIAFQVFFLLVYDVFLKNETFFNWNRLYLLATALLSVALPFVKVDGFKDVVPQQYIIRLPEVFIGAKPQLNATQLQVETINTQSQTILSWELLFYIGMVLAALLFLFKIGKIVWLLSQNPKSKIGKLLIVKLLNSSAAFSFFNYIFLGERLKETEKDSILKHEMVHVTQKHTLDLLFFEVARILFWFNPLIYMYQNRITTLHEFIADEQAVKHQNKSEYYQNLLTQIFDTNQISFINPFFKQSLIKKRIVMLQKSKSKQINLFKYVLLIPLVSGMLIYTSSYGQKITKVEVSKEDSITRDYNDNQLKDKYYKELLEKEKLGVSTKEIADAYILDYSPDTYIHSRVNYIKFQAYKQFISEKMNRFPSDAFEGFRERLLDWFPMSYNEYLEFKKTDRAKKDWENNAKAYTIRILVRNISDLTNEEQKDYDAKLKLLNSNDYYKKLIEADIHGKSVQLTVNREDLDNSSPIIKMISALKEQIQVQGNTNKDEEHGLNLLLKLAKSNTLNESLIKDVQAYSALNNKTPLMDRISDVFNQIQVQGNMTTEEELALKELLVFTSEGFNDPFFNDVIQYIDVPFAVIDEVPVYPGCESLTTNEERKKCMAEHISEFVNKNFNTKIGKENGLVGRQRINVMFKIDYQGHIVGVKSRAPHPALEAEAIRVIKSLPKMEPGKQRGKAVNVMYSLPIIFQVQEDKPMEQKE